MVYKAKNKFNEIEYVVWDGKNNKEIEKFLGYNGYVSGTIVDVTSTNGLQNAFIGDVIVKVDKSFYPCTYEKLKEEYDI